jgi:hypothetical protein
MKTDYLSTVIHGLTADAGEDYRYLNSPFRSLKQMQSRAKGAKMEALTRLAFEGLGYSVLPAMDTDYDLLVDWVKYEVKGATLVRDRNIFSFLQIRPDQKYDHMVFSMFYPDRLNILRMSKSQIVENISRGCFKKQHLGKRGESGTYCYYGNYESLIDLGAVELTPQYIQHEEAE